MFEIDKAKFGAFVAQLRKEKGLMQKDLAEKLYVSDKAVSKWERGLSIPDVALLVPLAELLGVSVTELLECRRLPQDTPMDSRQAEEIVKKVIVLTEEEQRKYRYPASALRHCRRAGNLASDHTGLHAGRAFCIAVYDDGPDGRLWSILLRIHQREAAAIL